MQVVDITHPNEIHVWNGEKPTHISVNEFHDTKQIV